MQVRVPGKLVLFGEYAVLEGAPAIVAPAPRFASVTIDNANSQSKVRAPASADSLILAVDAPQIGLASDTLEVDQNGSVTWFGSNGLPVNSPPGCGMLDAVFETVCGAELSSLNTAPNRLHVVVDTSDFFVNDGAQSEQKLGLGSSAAVCVALTKALLQVLTGAQPEPSRLFYLAFRAHKHASGGGSGVDVAASVFGTAADALRYQLATLKDDRRTDSAAITPLDWPTGLEVLAVFTGLSASTATMLRELSTWQQRNLSEYRNLLAKLRSLSELASRAFAGQDVGEVVRLAELYGEAMAGLGEASGVEVMSDRHHQLGRVVRTEGGAYKPSGAGLGDFGLAFCDDPKTRGRLEARLLAEGYKTVIALPGAVGVDSSVSDGAVS